MLPVPARDALPCLWLSLVPCGYLWEARVLCCLSTPVDALGRKV